MADSFILSDAGLKSVDAARKMLGFNKDDETWAKKAGVSPSTLKRLWQKLPITRDKLIAICSAIDKNWEDLIQKDEDQLLSWQYYAEKVLYDHKSLTSNIITSGSHKYDFEDVYIPVSLNQTYPIKCELEENEFFNEFKIIFQQDSPEKKQRIAIIGKPGQGKSTFLQNIAFWILENTDYLPIWISAGDLQHKDLKGELFKNYLLDHWLLNAINEFEVTEEVKKDFTQQFKDHKIWLILDGVDEIGEEIIKVLSILKQDLKGWIGESAILISCRHNVWYDNSGYLPEFQSYELADWRDGQIKNFISKWFEKYKKLAAIEAGKKLISKLQEKNYYTMLLKDLLKIPLFLTLWCNYLDNKFGQQTSYNYNVDFNYTNFELYQFFVQKFYEWKKDVFPLTMQQRNELEQNLQKIAFKGVNNPNIQEQTIFSPDKLEKEMTNSYMFWLCLQFGIFKPVTWNNEKKYMFYHLIFQYYYAVLEIEEKNSFKDVDPDDIDMTKLINNNLWHKSWIICAEIGNKQTNQFSWFFYEMIKRIIKDKNNYGKTYLGQVEELITKTLASSNEKLRQNAARSIREFTLRNSNNSQIINNDSSIEILVNLIKISNDYRTMLEIIWSLRDVGINSEIAFDALDELWGKYILEKKDISKEEYNIIIRQLKDVMLTIYLDTTDEELKKTIEPKLSSYQIL